MLQRAAASFRERNEPGWRCRVHDNRRFGSSGIGNKSGRLTPGTHEESAPAGALFNLFG